MSSHKSVTINGKHLSKSVQEKIRQFTEEEKPNIQNIYENKLIQIVIGKIKIR